MLHILFISYDKPTFKIVHLEVEDYRLLDIIKILFLFFIKMKYFKKDKFHEIV